MNILDFIILIQEKIDKTHKSHLTFIDNVIVNNKSLKSAKLELISLNSSDFQRPFISTSSELELWIVEDTFGDWDEEYYLQIFKEKQKIK